MAQRSEGACQKESLARDTWEGKFSVVQTNLPEEPLSFPPHFLPSYLAWPVLFTSKTA